MPIVFDEEQPKSGKIVFDDEQGETTDTSPILGIPFRGVAGFVEGGANAIENAGQTAKDILLGNTIRNLITEQQTGKQETNPLLKSELLPAIKNVQGQAAATEKADIENSVETEEKTPEKIPLDLLMAAGVISPIIGETVLRTTPKAGEPSVVTSRQLEQIGAIKTPQLESITSNPEVAEAARAELPTQKKDIETNAITENQKATQSNSNREDIRELKNYKTCNRTYNFLNFYYIIN